MPIYLYWGEEDFNLELKVQKLKEEILDPDWIALNHKVLEEPNIRNLTETLQSIPMSFGNVLIEINSKKLFMKATSDDNESVKHSDSELNKLFDALDNIGQNVYVLFKCLIPRDSKRKINSASKIVKHIQKIGEITEFKTFNYWEEDKVCNWISEQAKQKEISITKDASKLMFEKIGTDLRKLSLELDKLKLYAHPSKKISIENLSIINDEKEDIFKLANLWLNSDKSKSVLELSKVLETSHPIMILATLNTTLRKWIKLKIISEKTKNKYDIAKNIGMPPNFVERDLKTLSKIELNTLIKMKQLLYKTESDIKTGKMEDNAKALEVLLLS